MLNFHYYYFIMSIEKVREYFSQYGMDTKILEFPVSSATVELASQALSCEPARIAKTMSFMYGDSAILVVTAGDMKIDNHKYKEEFGKKATMLSPDEVVDKIGHAVGGVCPFGIPSDVEVYLDVSLKRFTTVFPACGSSNSAIELTIAQLEKYSNGKKWIDVCKSSGVHE
jgi:prolyl-tRNA editing enzyme YbaK/EbsC (Cys-tRNA(Pro) deacylase)